MFNFKFWNDPIRLYRESLHDAIRKKHYVQVPGYIGDLSDRGQPGRFKKWYKLPRAAHQLFWRTHKQYK